MSTVHINTHVLPGKRIEVSADDLQVGQNVRVTIEPIVEEQTTGRRGLIEFLDSLPPGPRSASSWEELERQLREERDAWDR